MNLRVPSYLFVSTSSVRALQTLCGLGCLEKEEKVVTYDQSGGRREAARRPQKQLRKNRQILQLLKRRDDIDTSDGRADEDEKAGQRERDEICNWEEMPAEKSSLTECECARQSTRPSGSVCENT